MSAAAAYRKAVAPDLEPLLELARAAHRLEGVELDDARRGARRGDEDRSRYRLMARRLHG